MAIEKFEDRKLTGAINVACKYDNGSVRYWTTTKEEVIEHIIDIVNEYADDGYILTLRQLHYQLVKSNWIVNHDTAYKKLGTILDDCRYGGLIDWDAIEDRGRVPYIPYSVTGVENALRDTIDQYRLDRQEGQKGSIELWTEKDALSGILRRTTSKYHIQLVVNKGYTSSTAIYNAYQRILTNLLAERHTTILYFGDHDPSGLDMVRDIHDRLTFMIENGVYSVQLEGNSEDVFTVKPIGLTMAQIKEFDLPPNPTKLTDTRSNKYVAKYGKTCWEVDALNPRTLTDIVETHIQEEIDIGKYKKMLKLEQEGIAELTDFIDSRNA